MSRASSQQLGGGGAGAVVKTACLENVGSSSSLAFKFQRRKVLIE